MRIEQRQPKIQEDVKIPDNLVSFFAEVQREIDAEDEVTTIESDDLMQYEEFDFAYGGLNDAETGEFTFRYFTDNENGSTWDLSLTKQEIGKIAEGELKQLTVWGCQNPLCGCKFSDEEGSCSNCDWVEEPKS